MDALLKSLLEDSDLKDLLKDDKNEVVDDAKLKGAIILIYNSSKERICNVADNVARGIISPDDSLVISDSPNSLELPEKEVWDFKLGDTVKIKLSRDDFKWMQRKTLGWRANLNEVHGQVGIVTNVYCEYENAIGVYFPDIFTGTSLYAGVLIKVAPRVDSALRRRWKVGDYVKTISSEKILAMLQRGLDKIPSEYVGKTGRVVGVTHPCIVVTFNNATTLDFKSSSLVPCDEGEITNEEFVHAREIKIGEQVRVISNLKRLINQQKDHGGWNASMTPIRGAKATVIHIQKDGSMNVQAKNGRAWRLNSDSVLREGESEEPEDDLKFQPGDVVKVIVPRNIRSILAMAEVPAVFLEYLRSPAVIALVDDDLDYYVRFNADQNVETHAKIIRKATVSEKSAYDTVKKLTDNLKVGDPVHLDVGPPNFVRSVMAELNMSQTETMAMTKPAILQGFANPYTAVIKYEDGTRIRVKRKFLTVPQKFHIDDLSSTVSIKTIEHIDETITRGVQDIHSREAAVTDDWRVTLTNMREGNPPCLEFRIMSTVADFKLLFDWLKDNSGWTTEYLCEGEFVTTINTAEPNASVETKVGVIFNEDPSEFRSKDDSDVREVSGSIEEGPEPSITARPIPEQRQDDPGVNNFNQFKYLRLFDPSLARNVYFPYVIHGNSRTPAGPVGPPPYPHDEYDRYDNSAIPEVRIHGVP